MIRWLFCLCFFLSFLDHSASSSSFSLFFSSFRWDRFLRYFFGKHQAAKTRDEAKNQISASEVALEIQQLRGVVTGVLQRLQEEETRERMSRAAREIRLHMLGKDGSCRQMMLHCGSDQYTVGQNQVILRVETGVSE